MRIEVNGIATISVRELSDKRVTHAIRLRAGKGLGPAICDIEAAHDILLRACGFCGADCRNYHFTFNDNYTAITGIKYLDDLHYCRQKDCPGKKFNPNSVAFVSKALALSEAEALKLIKSRNRSPFYRENHTSEAGYRAFQARLNHLSPDEKKVVVAKQNHSRSLAGYIERWGEHDGPSRWHLIQSSKAITPERMNAVHGEDDSRRYASWKREIACTLENFIRRHGEEEGTARYQSWLSKVTRVRGGYGIRTVIADMKFYSLLELRFYQAMIATGVTFPFQHDVQYPGVLWRSDFYFPLIDRHLEIAGMVGDKAYDTRLAQKIERYNPIIVLSPRQHDTIIQQLKDAHAQL